MILPTALSILAILSAGPPEHSDHEHGKHGNPANLEAYIKGLEEPGRDAWQKPDEVIGSLKVHSGQTVCDIGSGPGYFALRLGGSVGEKGAVYAVDIEPKILEALRDRIAKTGPRNVIPVLALPDDPLLPEGLCDVILIVDTFHHFPDQVAYLRRLGRSLARGGRIANIDFHKKELPVGPPVDHKISREEFLKKAAAAGFTVAAEETFLPYQYFIFLEPSRKK